MEDDGGWGREGDEGEGGGGGGGGGPKRIRLPVWAPGPRWVTIAERLTRDMPMPEQTATRLLSLDSCSGNNVKVSTCGVSATAR